MPVPMTLDVKPKTLVRILAGIIVCLAIAHFVSQYLRYVGGYSHQWGLERQFNLVNEANLPAWYSAVALLLSALLLSVVAGRERQAGGRDAWHWTGLALIFYFLSLDEAAQIHEMMTAFDRLSPTSIFYYSWVIVGIAFVGLVGLCYLGFLTRLPVTTRWTFVSAGSLYVAGALGIEMLEARYHYFSHSWTNLYYAVLVGIEEPLEMTGIAVFIYGISSYLARSGETLSIRFVEDGSQPHPLGSTPAVHTVHPTDRSVA